MKNNTAKIAACIALLALAACDTIKDFAKTKDNSKSDVTEEYHTYRKGDTVHFLIPNVQYRDTTIYNVNEQGTKIQLVYDNAGRVSAADCFSSKYDEMLKRQTKLEKDLLEKSKHKEVTQNFDWVIYLVIGFSIVMIFALFLLYLYVRVTVKNPL